MDTSVLAGASVQINELEALVRELRTRNEELERRALARPFVLAAPPDPPRTFRDVVKSWERHEEDLRARIQTLEEVLLVEADEWERVRLAFPRSDSRFSECRMRASRLRALAGKGE